MIVKDAMKKLICRQPGLGGEWQTGATGDNGGVELYQSHAETQPREDGSAAHRPPRN